MNSDRMNFHERFKGKTSIMDKQGIEGIVKQKALPIDKDSAFDENMPLPNSNSRLRKFSDIYHSNSLHTEAGVAANTGAVEEGKTPMLQSQFLKSSKLSLPQQQLSPLLTPSHYAVTEKPPTRIFTNIRSMSNDIVSSSRKFGDALYQEASSPTAFRRSIANSESSNISNNSENLFQNRLSQRVFSGISSSSQLLPTASSQQQIQPRLFASGNYEQAFRQLSRMSAHTQSAQNDQYNRTPQLQTRTSATTSSSNPSTYDYNPMQYSGSYRLSNGVNSIIVPSDYELIAVPRGQQFPVSAGQVPRLPPLNIFNPRESQLLKQQQQTPTKSSSSQQQAQFHRKEDINELSETGHKLLPMKLSLVNSAKKVLEQQSSQSTPVANRNAKKPKMSNGYQYELDVMEEKHKEIIDHLDKIRVKRLKN